MHSDKPKQRRHRIHPSVLDDPRLVLELDEKLGAQRAAKFKSLVGAYQDKPTLENYVRLRRDVPETEIDIALFGGLDPLYALEPELKKHNIDPQLVAGALDAFVPDMDELSLRLMECLAAKEKLPKRVPGYKEMHRE